MTDQVLLRALRLRGERPALLGHTGTGSHGPLRGLPLLPADLVVNLDRTPPNGDPLLAPAETGADSQGEGAGPAPEPVDHVGLVAVVATTVADLRRAVSLGARLPRTHQVVAVITSPAAHLDPPLPSAPGLGQWRDLQESRVARLDGGGWACELFFLEPVETAPALDAVAFGAVGRRRGPATAPPTALSGTEAPAWRPAVPRARGVPPRGPVARHRSTPVADIALRTGEGRLPDWRDDAVPAVDRYPAGSLTWERIGAADGVDRVREGTAGGFDPSRLPPVDERVVNPIGFTGESLPRVAEFGVRDGRAVIAYGRRVYLELPPTGAVTDSDIARLRDLRGVKVGWRGHAGPLAAARAVAGLAAGGVPLFCEEVPGWAEPLGPELTALLTSVTAADLDDRLARERHSIRLRRTALRTHGTAARWRELARQAGVRPVPETRVSVLLCTRRPDMVDFALAQVAAQRDVELEVVLALHGFTAEDPRVRRALDAFARTGRGTVVYEAPAGEVFGTVLNNAAGRASGTVIAKWDDDDWYGPHHLGDLLLARTYASADLVGCAQEFIYLEEIDRTVWRPAATERTDPFVAGGTLLLDRTVLEECGGFRPLPRAIDTQLLLGVAGGGGRIYRTHGHNYLVRRRASGHTWSEDPGYFLRDAARQWPGRRAGGLLLDDDPAGRAGHPRQQESESV
ncbi:glycosyl transferase family 2 [Streptomonospora nanhaiensis]|uniref:glycosyl transferase family 2 n=1 Tax=Streptomonospora nanhaiensis TaxID=1323731 RepID=UPI001C38B49F|nr:glycosyl transferase family 2 [Streptomonospora nanhaiensis]MBV2362317.1 glycosyl transferase family 2 [Streptomonospora nanhaiensis]